uniref:Uncharacterized protein n=1 Tax=Arundo donax TaxID=35708 RepID=A0A0A9DCY1_ARUDO
MCVTLACFHPECQNPQRRPRAKPPRTHSCSKTSCPNQNNTIMCATYHIGQRYLLLEPTIAQRAPAPNQNNKIMCATDHIGQRYRPTSAPDLKSSRKVIGP